MPRKPEKRSYVRQAEVKNRIVLSTLELLKSVDPEALTIREIAAHANTHHRYIPDYFGGKAQLLMQVAPIVRDELVEKIQSFSIEDFPSPELVMFVKLVGWLSINAPSDATGIFNGELLDTLPNLYVGGYGIEPVTARLMAKRMMAGVFSMVMFPRAMFLEEGDPQRLFQLEQRVSIALVEMMRNDN